jgi:hypothetical protein
MLSTHSITGLAVLPLKISAAGVGCLLDTFVLLSVDSGNLGTTTLPLHQRIAQAAVLACISSTLSLLAAAAAGRLGAQGWMRWVRQQEIRRVRVTASAAAVVVGITALLHVVTIDRRSPSAPMRQPWAERLLEFAAMVAKVSLLQGASVPALHTCAASVDGMLG